MCKSELSYLDWTLVFPLAWFVKLRWELSVLSESVMLWVSLACVAADLVYYCSAVCLDICDHMRVHLFKIPAPKN